MFNLIISFLGILGFTIAFYIYKKKKTKKKLICPMKSDCDTVIHSDYSEILGVKIEILGMLYYAFIAIVYYSFDYLRVEPYLFMHLVFVLSAFSTLFSIYLVFVQTFIIRQWCVWCLCSFFVSGLIFVFSYLNMLT